MTVGEAVDGFCTDETACAVEGIICGAFKLGASLVAAVAIAHAM